MSQTISEFVNKDILVNSASMSNSGRYFQGSRMSRLAFDHDNEDDDEDESILLARNSLEIDYFTTGDEDEDFLEKDYNVILRENEATNSEIASWRPNRYPTIYNVSLVF